MGLDKLRRDGVLSNAARTNISDEVALEERSRTRRIAAPQATRSQ
jgi:hypothetical protein